MSFFWSALPAELRLLVLEELSRACNCSQPTKNRPNYAAVSREWQAYFERETFHSLVLPSSCLDEFEHIIERRRTRRRRKGSIDERHFPLIKHIWLRIELEEYDCTVCKLEETQEEIAENNVIFTNALWKFLTTLSKVTACKSTTAQGLTLELSAHSRSDGQHMFQDFYQLGDDYPHLADYGQQYNHIKKKERAISRWDLEDQFHGFSRGRRAVRPQDDHDRARQAQRLLRPLVFDFREIDGRRLRNRSLVPCLPRVSIITGLEFRRQYNRCLSTATLNKVLNESLPNLTTMRHERWRPGGTDAYMEGLIYGDIAGSFSKIELRDLFQPRRPGLPCNLTRFHVFEDFDIRLHGRRPRFSRMEFLRRLKAIAPTLEHLSVAFLTDAWTLSDHIKASGWKPKILFPRLKSLALTSEERFENFQGPAKIRNFINAAAKMAAGSPKLEIMELWDKYHFFRYDKTISHDTSTITYASTCYEPNLLDSKTIEAWRVLDPSRAVACETWPLPEARYYWTGTILRHLKLREMILDPVSLLQLRAEAGDFGQPEVAAYRP